MFETYKSVEVAEVLVARVMSASVRVEEALEMKPAVKSRVVEVACSFVPSFVNGHWKVMAPELQPVHEATVRFPMLATLARKLVVEARPET